MSDESEWATTLPDWVKEGATYRYDYGPDNHNTGRVFHVRGVVDGLAIVREWSKIKKRWGYTVKDPTYFDVYKDRISR